MLDVTLEPLSDEDCGGVAELVPAVDVGIKAVLDALLGLFRRDMAVEPPAIMMKYHIERSNILCYFRKVRANRPASVSLVSGFPSLTAQRHRLGVRLQDQTLSDICLLKEALPTSRF